MQIWDQQMLIDASSQDSCTHNELMAKASTKIVDSIHLSIRDVIFQFVVGRGCILKPLGAGSMRNLPTSSSSERLRLNRKARRCKDSSDLGPRRLKRRLEFIRVTKTRTSRQEANTTELPITSQGETGRMPPSPRFPNQLELQTQPDMTQRTHHASGQTQARHL
jgi:hypothetical protein